MASSITRLNAPQNLTALAYDSIKRYILEGDLDEEARLTEEFLSTRLGISKSPVREALNSLQTEGLIRIEPRRGAFVRRFTAKDIRDLYNLREVLEAYAVSIATITPALIEELRSSVERTRELIGTGNKIGHIDEDTRFHRAIVRASGNEELCRVLTNIQSQLWLCRCRSYDLSAATTVTAHLSIVESLQQNDRTAAQERMRNHIALVRERLVAFTEKQQSAAADGD